MYNEKYIRNHNKNLHDNSIHNGGRERHLTSLSKYNLTILFLSFISYTLSHSLTISLTLSFNVFLFSSLSTPPLPDCLPCVQIHSMYV